MNDDSMVQIMQTLGLNYNPAINATLKFEKSIGSLNKQLAEMKMNAMKGAKDINNTFSSQLGSMTGSKTIVDQFGAPLKTVQTEAKKSATTIKDMANQYDAATNNAKQHGKAVKDVNDGYNILGSEFQRRSQWFLTGTMFYGVINGAKEALSTIKDVEMGMVEIARVMEDSNFVFNDYRDDLLKLGVDYGQTFDNVQDISLRWAQAGYNVKDSLQLTQDSLMALNTAELDATNATESMIGIMAQWQLQAEDLSLVMDKVNKTADNYTVTSQDLVDGLLRSSSAARNMNMTLDETIGLLTTMREASGRTGAEVGNALNSILSYVQRPGSIKTLESMGIQMFTDSTKSQFRNALEIFKDISTRWGSLSGEIQDGFVKSADDAGLFSEELATALGIQEEWNDVQQRDVSQASAGVYRRNYFIGMIERMSNVQGILNGMMDAEGYSMAENARTMDTLEKKNQSLKTSMEALAVAMGDAGLGGTLSSLAEGGTSALNFISEMPKGTKDAVMGFTNVFLAVKTAQIGMKVFGLEVPKIGSGVDGLTTSVMGLAGSFKKAFVANLPLLAIAAVTGAIIALYNAVKKAKEEQEKYIQTTKDNIQNLGEQKQGLVELSKEYETLKAKEKNLTATADEKTRLRDIQRELVDLYDVSITGIDAEGQAYSDSVSAIQDRIKALENLKEAELANLEVAVKAKDIDDVGSLQDNLQKQQDYANKLIDIQKKIQEVEMAHANRENLNIGGVQVTPNNFRYDAKADEYIQSLYQLQLDTENALNSTNETIKTGTSDRQQLLKEDATKIVTQLGENGVKISDSARTYATELAGALAQVPMGISTLRETLESEIEKFTSSDFEKLSKQYKDALAIDDTKGINEASKAIGELVGTFVQGKPALDNWAIAIQGIYPNSQMLTKATFDLEQSLANMSTATRSAITDTTELNNVIADVKKGNVLTGETVLDLIDKYDLSADSIKEVTGGYKIEIGVLEGLRKTKLQVAIDAIEAEKRQAEATKIQVQSRLDNYGLEIDQLLNLAKVRAILAQQASTQANRTGMDTDSIQWETSYQKYYTKANADVSAAQQIVKDIQEIENQSKLLTNMLNNGNYGDSSSAKKEKKTGNKQLDDAIALLEHKKKMSEETQESIKSEIVELNRINKLYAKTEDERMNMSERIYSAEKRFLDKRFQDSVDWINKKKSLNELSVEEEIAAWERVRNNQLDNIEAQNQATFNLCKLKNQLAQESYALEESTIEHLKTFGILSVEDQIEAYKKLYELKAESLEDERDRVENLFGLYKELADEQIEAMDKSYNRRVEQINNEAEREVKSKERRISDIEEETESRIKAKERSIEAIEEESEVRKAIQNEIIAGINKELELLNLKENQYDHDEKMANLQEELAYWQVRTSEDAREKVADIIEQIDEAEHDRKVELEKQGLEEKKDVAEEEIRSIEDATTEKIRLIEEEMEAIEKSSDRKLERLEEEIEAIEKAADRERETWEKSYSLVEEAFDEHTLNVIALARTMSKDAYDEWEKNYLIPLQRALEDGDSREVRDRTRDLDNSINDLNEKTSISKNAQIYSLAKSILGYKKQYEVDGDTSAANSAKSVYKDLEGLSPKVADMLQNMNYISAKDYVAGLPKMHGGGKSLSYGAVEMMPGELTFPPDLSIKLESLIGALYQKPSGQSSSSSLTDNRKEVNIDTLLKVENIYMEDDIDQMSLARELQRQIKNLY